MITERGGPQTRPITHKQPQPQPQVMTTQFKTLKNGKVSVAVWANPTTQEIYPANRNSFGWNAEYHLGNPFWDKYGKNLKTTQGRVNYRRFYYSAKSMESVGFKLVLRGDAPLWDSATL